MPKWRALTFLLGCFLGLCAIFALIVTLGEAWQEHAQAHWPKAEARIERCAVEHYHASAGLRDGYRIDCRVTYFADGAQVAARILSQVVPSPGRASFPDPMIRIGQMQDWANGHPRDARIRVHYNPAHPKEAVLAETDMPMGGPHTPSNLRLLGGFAAACLFLLMIGKRPRNPPPSVSDGPPSIPADIPADR